MIDISEYGKLKRYFRAKRKLNLPDFISHITQRAAGREPLFLEEDDYLYMIGLLADISSSYSLNVYAFCLMPDHIHVLLSPTETNLYDAMRDLYSRYAMRFNRKYERKGHLFAGPYRQAVCLDDSYLLTASLYIHLNPARAGIVPDPFSYQWSSVQLYTDAKAPDAFVDPRFVLDLLSQDPAESKRQYTVLIEEVKALASADPQSRKAKRFLIEQLISRGFKRHEIADRLGISRKTVYNILKS